MRTGHRLSLVLAGLTLAATAATGVTASAMPARHTAGTGHAGHHRTAHAAATSSAVTVAVPGAGDHASVTVSTTKALVNQTIEVSWQGFRPSSATRLQNSGDSLDVNTEDPVRVYECRGDDPASSSDCYGSPGFRGIDATDSDPGVPAVPAFTYPGQTDAYAATPDGPANWEDNVTGPDGSGEVSIQVFTKRESASLGCDATSPCSIVIVPNYGRPGTAAGDTEDAMDAPWAWARHTAVPLTFQPVDDACPLTQATLGVEGSPIAAAVLASWRARTCVLAQHAVGLDYTAIGEPQTREDVASGVTQAGLTIDPLTAAQAKAAHVVYAPMTNTGLVVAFQVDDANGQPVTSMRLDPRLVAKLITASYRSGGDPAVLHNPVNLFHDPEFLKLNPGVAWPSGAPGNHVLLLGDLSDLTEQLTTWIESDKDARDFLAGKPDPWGMTVNSNYHGLKLPIATFPLLDQDLSASFAPVQELDALSRQLSIAQFPGGYVENDGGVNVTVKQPRQNPGSREVIGIIDAPAAARFRLATASLENASGRYVAPTAATMTAAIKDAKVGPDGVTRTANVASKDTSSYPLTVQVTGAFSASAGAATRTQMGDLLSYVAGAGQKPGDGVGQLPPGDAALTATQLQELSAARTAIGKGVPSSGPSSNPSSDPSSTPSSSSSDTTSPGSTDPGSTDPSSTDPGTSDPGSTDPGTTPGSTTPSTSPTDTPSSAPSSTTTPTAQASDLITVHGTPAGGGGRMLVLLVLAVGVLTLVSGPTLLWLSRSGRGPQWLRR